MASLNLKSITKVPKTIKVRVIRAVFTPTDEFFNLLSILQQTAFLLLLETNARKLSHLSHPQSDSNVNCPVDKIIRALRTIENVIFEFCALDKLFGKPANEERMSSSRKRENVASFRHVIVIFYQ